MPASQPTILLIHGAYADGSGWRRVISLLQERGLDAIAVQNPLTSFADDVATTKRAIEAQAGPLVVVGHSYGGAVITAAASGSANVKALVYIAAHAPDAGEKISELRARFGPSALGQAVVRDAAGFLSIDRARFHELFCHDVDEREARLMAATQKPIAAAAFEGAVEVPSWKAIPSWYLVATDDLAIKPELQRFMAERMGARTSEVKSSHVPFVSQPQAVVDVILAAAASASQSAGR